MFLVSNPGKACFSIGRVGKHTYSDKLKNAAGDDMAKAALMGHTNYDFTKKKYQSTSIEDLQAVVNSIT